MIEDFKDIKPEQLTKTIDKDTFNQVCDIIKTRRDAGVSIVDVVNTTIFCAAFNATLIAADEDELNQSLRKTAPWIAAGTVTALMSLKGVGTENAIKRHDMIIKAIEEATANKTTTEKESAND